MSYSSFITFLLLLLSWIPSLSLSTTNPTLPFRAVNLGNWLVTEGWMKSSRFNGIPNNDLLDGTQVQFMSSRFRKYLCAEDGGGTVVVADRPSASGWETFRLWRINETYFSFRVFNKQFVGIQNSGRGENVVAVSNGAGGAETFQIVTKDGDGSRVRIRSANGRFVQIKSETVVTADYTGSSWDDGDPSVFIMTIVSTMTGEYQLTNGYGPDKAPQILKEHWSSYITQKDFEFLYKNGVNAVRIPVGWWIAHDPSPPKPFVGGSSQVLDNAFTWAQNNGIKVIIDLHALESSQNGEQHSASRDAYLEWGDSKIPETVAVIEFLAQRYGSHPSLAAIELMNEPVAAGVDLDALKRYYKAGYEAVRKYTADAYVIFSNRLGDADPKELLSFAATFDRVVIDVHYYNLFSPDFKSMNVLENIDYIYNQRASDLNTIMGSNGPLVFVGEWTGEFDANERRSMEDYQRFVKAQVDVYGRASFGWSYWSYKCEPQSTWSLQWMIQNNYINI